MIDDTLDICPTCSAGNQKGKLPLPDAYKTAGQRDAKKDAEKRALDKSQQERHKKEISDHASASGKLRREGKLDESVNLSANILR
jgi:hypothetical protein